MADIAVDTATTTLPNARNVLRGPYWISPDDGAVVFLDSNGDPSVRYTSDKGATRTKKVLYAATGVQVAAFFEREIPGNTGTAIYIAFADNVGAGTGALRVAKRDFTSPTSAGVSNVATGLTFNGTSANNKVCLGLTASGNIIAGYVAGASSTATYKRAGWTGSRSSITNVYEGSSDTDIAHIFPANTADGADAACIFWDVSADEVSVKMYDDSANTRTETSILTSAPESHSVVRNIDGAIRHSDKHLLLTFFNNYNVATADLVTYDLTLDSIASPTITGKTAVFSNTANAVQPAIVIDQQTNDVYIGCLKNGTWLTSESVVFYKSTDDMTSWGSEQAYSETARNYRIAHGGRTISSDGGRIQFSAIEFTAFDLWINHVNDIEIAVAASTSIKTINGLAYASVKSVNGLAIASVKSINGLA